MAQDLEKSGSSSELVADKVRKSGWARTSAIILADAVGTGVLSLSRALAQLGWGPGLFCLVVTVPLFWLAGFFVMKVHIHVDSNGESARTYGDLFGALVGPIARKYGYALVYSLAFMSTASYMLTIANSIQQLFYDMHVCLPIASLCALVLVLPGTQLRALHYLAPHAWTSFASLLVVILIALSFLLSDGASCDNDPPKALDFWGAFNAVGSFIWAYAGISYYPEMLSEMKRPQDFARKSLGFAIVVMSSMYLAVSTITYAKCGDGTPDSLVLVIPKGPWLRVASILMIYHVMITYLVSSQVLIHGIVCACGLVKALEPGLGGRALWFGISFTLTMIAYIFADAVPQFDNLNDLTGNIVCAQGCLVLPALFFILVQRVAPWKDGPVKTGALGISGVMLILGLFLTVSGGLGSVITIWQDAHSDAQSKPFACQALS